MDTDHPTALRGFDSYEVRLGDELRGHRATLGKSLLDVQRELRIKASYIDAIENCDASVIPNKGFVPGCWMPPPKVVNHSPDRRLKIMSTLPEEVVSQTKSSAAGRGCVKL